MQKAQKYAIDAAKEITITLLQNTQSYSTGDGGESVGNFFQAVYRKVLEIAKEALDDQ